MRRVKFLRIGHAVDEDLHAIHLEPIGALHAHYIFSLPPGAFRSSPTAAVSSPWSALAWTSRNGPLVNTILPCSQACTRFGTEALGRIVGRRLDVVAQAARAVKVPMGVGIDNARHAIAQVHQLQPVKDRVPLLALVGQLLGLREDRGQRMDFDHVHEAEHLLEAAVGRAVQIAVRDHLHDVRMIDLHQLVGSVFPHGQPLDLHDRVDIRQRGAAILRARMRRQRKGVLMVDRQRPAGQFHAGAGQHPLAAKNFRCGS